MSIVPDVSGTGVRLKDLMVNFRLVTACHCCRVWHKTHVASTRCMSGGGYVSGTGYVFGAVYGQRWLYQFHKGCKKEQEENRQIFPIIVEG